MTNSLMIYLTGTIALLFSLQELYCIIRDYRLGKYIDNCIQHTREHIAMFIGTVSFLVFMILYNIWNPVCYIFVLFNVLLVLFFIPHLKKERLNTKSKGTQKN